MVKGLLIEKGAGGYQAQVKDIELPAAGPGDVTVRVEHSTLNYKDALAITGKAPIVRTFPMVPGIDFAGVVEASQHPAWKTGDRVVLNGWGVGETHWGGLAQRAQVKGDLLVRLPAGLTSRDAMAIGTAGYTAMLSVLALERHGITPDKGDVIVTGAAGGVGSVAVAVLAKLGYRVVAATGRPQEADYLKGLGAGTIVERSTLTGPARPLAKEQWAGAVDTVGGNMLANVIAATKQWGVVTACGLAGGMDLPTSVAPFILRGVTLVGIESVRCPMPERERAWQRLATDLDLGMLKAMTTEVGLAEAVAAAATLLEGKVRGRIVVDVNR